jgi:hypothetical protein
MTKQNKKVPKDTNLEDLEQGRYEAAADIKQKSNKKRRKKKMVPKDTNLEDPEQGRYESAADLEQQSDGKRRTKKKMVPKDTNLDDPEQGRNEGAADIEQKSDGKRRSAVKENGSANPEQALPRRGVENIGDEEEDHDTVADDDDGDDDDHDHDDDDDAMKKKPICRCIRRWCWQPHVKVTILSLCLTVLGIMKLFCYFFSFCPPGAFFKKDAEIWFLIVFCSVSLLYLMEVLTSNSFQYLCSVMNEDELMEYMDMIYNTPPVIEWHIQCYHIVIRQERHRYQYSDENGNTQYAFYTTEREVRVDTHSATGRPKITHFRDISDRGFLADTIAQYGIVKVSLKKSFVPDLGYHDQQNEFLRTNIRDLQYDFETVDSIPGLYPRLLVAARSSKPHFAHWTYFLICHGTVVLALPYRMWLSNITDCKTRYVVRKEVYTD